MIQTQGNWLVDALKTRVISGAEFQKEKGLFWTKIKTVSGKILKYCIYYWTVESDSVVSEQNNLFGNRWKCLNSEYYCSFTLHSFTYWINNKQGLISSFKPRETLKKLLGVKHCHFRTGVPNSFWAKIPGQNILNV